MDMVQYGEEGTPDWEERCVLDGLLIRYSVRLVINALSS